MRWLPIIILLCAPLLSAQTINEKDSRFLSAPHGRTGCYAPYRLVVEDISGDTLTVASGHEGVRLEKQMAVAGKDRVEVVLPVMVSGDARVEAGGVTIEPRLPIRRVEPDYERPFVAVFSPDPVGARAVLPSVTGSIACDYFELGEFFTDWRLLHGYDALVIFNPSDVRLPSGSQRTIAEFCSLGGAVFIGGSFRFGEKAVNLPAPVGPEILPFRDVSVQRFAYGPGAIYRAGWQEIERSRSAQLVVRDALLDHLWHGADKPPGGEPASRAMPERPPLARPLPPGEIKPGLLFWGLGGALLLFSLVAPLVVSRLMKARWVAALVVLAGCVAVGGVSRLQERPHPRLEFSRLVMAGEGAASSTIDFVQVEEEWGETLTVNLAEPEDRRLPIRVSARPGWNGWMVLRPLAGNTEDVGERIDLAYGMVGELSFRDFSTAAHRGNTVFREDDAWLLEWWLDANAYRGRFATLAPIDVQNGVEFGGETYTRRRGAIRVTNERARR